ncbi:MAG: hypothetical protein SGARI_005898 [Bacillariaceae sp.]
MIRNLASRRTACAIHATGVRACVALDEVPSTTCSRPSRRSFHDGEERSSRARRGTSPISCRIHYEKVMQPKSATATQRSFGTSYLQDSFYEPSLHSHLAYHQYRDYDEGLTGYVAASKGAMETTLSAMSRTEAIMLATTDGDMDIISDDEEWLPGSVETPAAEQVLAMMDTSYYHASYRAKSHADDSVTASVTKNGHL